MSNIIPKLNLNKTPNVVEPYSLVFAKNIRLDVDGTIHKDYSINPMTWTRNNNNLIIYPDIISRIKADIKWTINNSSDTLLIDCCEHFLGYIDTIIHSIEYSFNIVGTISDNKSFYIFIRGVYKYGQGELQTIGTKDFIFVYDENTDKFTPCNCNWTYSGGKISGCVINNLYGEKILNIGETSDDSSLIPLKCINLSKSHYTDDESLYTQSPNIPIINLNLISKFSYVIPNGVYQFFVRYKIREGFYTDWFPASKELFAGNNNNVITNFGSLNYVNEHTDATESFVLDLNILYKEYTKNYDSFQIGFILSHDDTIYARAWKHFDFKNTSIKFDYNAKDAQEIEVTDLTKVTYNIFNVGNITNFKNKLYISNYTETDFNEDFNNIASNVKIDLQTVESSAGYGDYKIIESSVNGKDVVSAFILKDEVIKPIKGDNGIISDMLQDKTTGNSFDFILGDSVSNNNSNERFIISNLYDLNLSGDRTLLKSEQQNISIQIRERQDYVSGPVFNDNITDIFINKVRLSTPTKDNVLTYIKNKIAFLGYDGSFYDELGNLANSFDIDIQRQYSWVARVYKPSTDDDHPRSRNIAGGSSGGSYVNVTYTGTYHQKININFRGYVKYFTKTNIDNLINLTTLIPYQKYKFYIHFVKQTGEITNGYFCNGAKAGIITVPDKPSCDNIIYPKFSNIVIPDGYVACFFSIFHCAVNVSTIFNLEKIQHNGGIISIEGSSIEMNTRLIPFKDINGKQGSALFKGSYHDSGDSSIMRYFGADGIIKFDSNLDINTNRVMYAFNDYDSQQDEDITLIKCTPFIKKEHSSITYDDYTNLNLLGYICKVTPLDRNRVTKYYSDGNSVYKKEGEFSSEEITNPKVLLTELGKYNDDTERLRDFSLIFTNKVHIYSNYNLNYLALSDDVKLSIKTYYDKNKDTNSSNNDYTTQTVLLRLLTSITLNDIYKLPSMYKSYTRKTYSVYNDNSVITFNNTVRSSVLEGDEDKISVFKFDSEDYYNIPTNRGIIINMISIGDAIIVHTTDSMFRFNGNNILSGSTGEITTTETQPFNTGVSEIFGSEFGYAGLQNKNDYIVTEAGYIFFDRDSKIVYMYSGQNQLIKISDSIEKLFKWKNITDVYFANDYYNNRFFMSILFDNNVTTTLSFSLIDTIKSFISIHDFYFDYAFNTKTKCYFLNLNKDSIYYIDKQSTGYYIGLDTNTDSIYPSQCDFKRQLYIDGNTETQNYININRYHSIVDVIYNANYEIIKTLNSISWISNSISSYFENVDMDNLHSLKMTESLNYDIPVHNIRIYTDTCISDIIPCELRSNDCNIANPNSWKYPRFNQGKWSLNYFRDIQNAIDLKNYLPKYNDGRNGATFRSDDNSLIEGKYFVVRFIFNDEFKLETLEFNYSNKI